MKTAAKVALSFVAGVLACVGALVFAMSMLQGLGH